ncbi:hypothetical protein SAMN05444920_101699 [Nonomuraea solani]|uniref:Uncharacterized protein n=1 Tax=Nonomuraea solani TaxID=1144553 RepID=A0A1H5V0Q3_9ACTN|nr:hypothetical protein [Nonomuraea solani]SEF80057.1 hypothetical protein SAMN05444920_101699 [Nonomuraea solani]
MSGHFEEALMSGRAPQPGGVRPLGVGDSESSEGVAALLQATEPERIAQAGRNYLAIARMCEESVGELSAQARAISETLGGESLKGIFETIGELQKDLARIHAAATTVGRPLEWYGAQVLPWFKGNVPGTGSVSLDDDLFDSFGAVEDNGHALARHHLRLLNAYMGDVYHAVEGYVEQRSNAPQVSMTDPSLGPSLGLPPGGLTGDPYSGAGLPSPYGTPGFGTPDGLGNPNIPGLDDPSLKDPSLKDPSLTDPSLQNPSLQDPSLQNPSLRDPSLQTPQTPDLKAPGLNTPNVPPLTTPTTTDLSSLQPYPGVPPTGLPGQPPGGSLGGPSMSPGSSPVTPFGTAGAQGLGGARVGAAGMPMGMMPPMMGGGQGNQERDRERDRLPLVEDEAFESDDMGGPSVIA